MAISKKITSEIHFQDLPQQLMGLKKKLRIADKLIALNHDDESAAFGAVTKIDSLISLFTLDLANNLGFQGPGDELLVLPTVHSWFGQGNRRPKMQILREPTRPLSVRKGDWVGHQVGTNKHRRIRLRLHRLR